MTAKEVQLIGQVQGATVDWSLVAKSLGLVDCEGREVWFGWGRWRI